MSQLDDLLEQLRVAYPSGMPGLFRTLTGNRAVLAGFMALEHHAGGDDVLSAADRLIVGVMTAKHLDCAGPARPETAQEGRDDSNTPEAVLRGCLPEHLRARALVLATQRLLDTSGGLSRVEMVQFARVGLDEEALLAVIAVIGEITMATHANNLVRTRIDPGFRDMEYA